MLRCCAGAMLKGWVVVMGGCLLLCCCGVVLSCCAVFLLERCDVCVVLLCAFAMM